MSCYVIKLPNSLSHPGPSLCRNYKHIYVPATYSTYTKCQPLKMSKRPNYGEHESHFHNYGENESHFHNSNDFFENRNCTSTCVHLFWYRGFFCHSEIAVNPSELPELSPVFVVFVLSCHSSDFSTLSLLYCHFFNFGTLGLSPKPLWKTMFDSLFLPASIYIMTI